VLRVQTPIKGSASCQQAGMITLLIGAAMTLYLCSVLIPAGILGVSVYPLFEAAQNSGVFIFIALLGLGTFLTCVASANGCVCDSSRSWFALSRDNYVSSWFRQCTQGITHLTGQ